MPLHTSHTGTCRDIKNPCEVRSTRLRLSTVSRTSKLSLAVSLASTTTTTNHLALPCPVLPRLSLHWRLSVQACCSWLSRLAGHFCVRFNLERGQCTQFRNGGLFLFFKMPSSTFSLLSSFPLLFLPLSSFSFSMFLSSRGACGPVGRGLIPSAWGFCQSLVPFCVMVLTEWTPHLTPIELWGCAAGRPAQANAAPCSAW